MGYLNRKPRATLLEGAVPREGLMMELLFNGNGDDTSGNGRHISSDISGSIHTDAKIGKYTNTAQCLFPSQTIYALSFWSRWGESPSFSNGANKILGIQNGQMYYQHPLNCSLAQKEWYHCVIQRGNNSYCACWINGEYKTTASNFSYNSWTLTYLSWWGIDESHRSFARVRTYDRVLSQDEIEALYKEV